MNKYYKPLTLVIAFLILSLVTVASFAYFSASVQGNDNAYDTVITTGEMALMLNDGEQVGLNNAIPGDSITKEFSVKNTGTVETTYDVYFSELINLFEDKNDLVYTLTSENGCADSDEKVFPSRAGEESKFISACSIMPNQIHSYTLTVTFKDDGTNQDDNKGKSVISKLSVNEYNKVAYLIDGNSFNSIIKKLAIDWNGYNEYSSTCYDNEDDYLYDECHNYCEDKQDECKVFSSIHVYIERGNFSSIPNNNINKIIFTNENKNDEDGRVIISSDESDATVYGWIDNNVFYIYSESSDIYLNQDSSNMFSKYSSLDLLDITRFNFSLVENLKYFFGQTKGTNGTVINSADSINAKNVKNMEGMFVYSSLNNYDIVKKITTSNLLTTENMFGNVKTDSSLDLSNIDFSSVQNMRYMFYQSKFSSINFENFSAEEALRVDSMFEGSEIKNIFLGDNFNAKNVNDARYMFSGAKTEEINLGRNFNLASNADVRYMFQSTEGILDMGNNFNGSNISSTHYMFLNTRLSSINLESFDTSSVLDASYMFNNSYYALTSLKFGDKFDTSKVTNFSRMFSYCSKLEELYLGDKFVVNQNADVSDFLYGDGELKKIYIGPHSIFNSLNTQIFNYNYKLIGGSGTIYDDNKNTGEYFRIDDPEHGKPGYLTLDPRYQ